MCTPLISFVIAVYNNPIYIKNAIASIYNQKCKCFEIIIIDDGSTDETALVVDQIAEKYEEVKAFHQENQWIYASFNNGIRKASGEYIYILNSDDQLTKGSLNTLMMKIEQYNHPDVIWTRVLHRKTTGGQIVSEGSFGEAFDEEIYCDSNKELADHWLFIQRTMLNANQANLYKRSFFERFSFRNDYFGADAFINIAIAKEIRTCLILPDPVYIFCDYCCDTMNASARKYYSHSTKMYNELYTEQKKLLSDLNIFSEDNIEYYRNCRRRQFSTELSTLLLYGKGMTLDQKSAKILNIKYDGVLKECIYTKEEFEARILSAFLSYFRKVSYDKEWENNIVYRLLKSLLRFEKDEEDMVTINNIVNSPLNPNKIGASFYQKLIN